MHLRLISRLSTLAVLALLLGICGSAQDTSRRLILKDGSYQLVTKYEVHGDRVRYFSSEREDWEEIPNSLVDWPATEKYQRDFAATKASVPEAVQLDNELERDRDAQDAKLPEVAPGLHLPDPSGVFLLDNFKGEPQLDEINQTAGDVNKQAKANIFRSMAPLAGAKQTIELDGAHAAIQSHVDVPTLYLNNVDEAPAPFEQNTPGQPPAQAQQPQQAQQPIVAYDRFRIVHVEVKGGKRIIAAIKREPTGKIVQDQKIVKTTITNLNGGWLKLSPSESLTPGEYAVVEMTEKGMNLYVWDFGIDPKAPPNANPYKPDVKLPEPLMTSSATTPTNNATCTDEVGPDRSKQLVEQCLQVSPATHPPCNAQNSCQLIIDEIKRSCALLAANAPKFCSEYH